MKPSSVFRSARLVASTAALCLSVTVVGYSQDRPYPQERSQDPRYSGDRQRPQGDQDQRESNGISAGGNWLEFSSDDKMTGARRVRFELQSNNYFREDPNYRPRVTLYCESGKLKLADFNPGVRLPPPNRPGFWGQPQLEVQVRLDDVNYYKGWNWAGGRNFLSMDKTTVRRLLHADVFNVAMRTRSGRQIAEFSPQGIDLRRVREACDVTPKRP